MLIARVLTALLAAALLTLVAAGLLVRRRASLCWSFLAYVLVVLACNRLIAVWPERFFVFTFYSMKETANFVLKVLIALEIWLRSFASFPRARVRVGFLLAGTLLMTAAAVRMIPTDLDPYDTLICALFPRQQAGTLALFAILVTAASWYRVPLHPLHRAILVGFAAYLTLNACVTSLIGFQGGEGWIDRLGWLDQVAYLATTLWWAWASWRPVRAPSPTISRLQPWAHSW